MTAIQDQPFGSERLTRSEAPISARRTWWSAYADVLASSGIGQVSRDVIERDAEDIVGRGVLGAGPAGSQAWPSSRVRTGVVMGAVQSGKTASMMAVAAKALDAGVDAVVILGGTRTALWLQTLERVVSQLDTLPDSLTRRVLLPSAPLADGDSVAPDTRFAYRMTPQLGEKVATGRRPLISVVMKNTAHLAAFAATLQRSVYPVAERVDRPFHLLVLDDEADDSSVADVAPETVEEVRQVPRRILDLWESRQQPGKTMGSKLYATYLAYTATPQANFLQDTANALAPRDFAASLRTPGAAGHPDERSPTYRVPEGPLAWYTGGDIYYRALDVVPLCRVREHEADDDLTDAVRAYLVSCAVRLLRAPGRLGPLSARREVFSSRSDVEAGVAAPMSMLVHPSAAKDQHFEMAGRLLAWSAGARESHGRSLLAAGARHLHLDGVLRDLAENREAWTKWLTDYSRSALLTKTTLGLPTLPPVPDLDRWDEVERLLVDEVVPGTRVAVINSDEDSDQRPRFAPVVDPAGGWRAAPNLSTIFVSGNVMSRGLTLEGLSTTYFSRRSGEPLADTQMQMQRWFGYRAKYIDLCRVMLTPQQLELFRQYHDNDEALRREVLAAMRPGAPLPKVTVLQGRTFRATGKINNVRPAVLWPGPKPFVRLVNTVEADVRNAELVARLFSAAPLLSTADGGRRGLVLEDTLDLIGTADLLDQLSYSKHGPGVDGGEAVRWAAVAKHAELQAGDPCFPLYRAPKVSNSTDLGLRSPYAIAAYLRLWAAALDRRVPGLVTTDEPPKTWNLLDLEVLRRRQPRFSIGLRFGGGDAVTTGPLSDLGFPVRVMERALDGDFLTSEWGSRGAGSGGIRGDEQFDLIARGIDVRTGLDGSRPAGSDGQVLFHVIHRNPSAVVAVGVVLPLGGPDHVRAERWGHGV